MGKEIKENKSLPSEMEQPTDAEQAEEFIIFTDFIHRVSESIEKYIKDPLGHVDKQNDQETPKDPSNK